MSETGTAPTVPGRQPAPGHRAAVVGDLTDSEAEMTSALRRAAEESIAYLADIRERPVGATASYEDLAGRLAEALPDAGISASAVIDELIATTDGGIVASGSPRYFGFVIGGALPAAIAADWMTSAWDQNAGLSATGPAIAVVEAAAARWVLQALELPAEASVAIVSGCQMAHVTCLAAARHHVLAARGHDVEGLGLGGAPPIRVLASELSHVTLTRALRLLGIGENAIEVIPVDRALRMRADVLVDRLGSDDRPTIVCAQLGEINTGAMDPIDAIADATESAGAWLHVDGAFGLWARASRRHRHLAAGAERADSWATDAHKWLNVPYDCGFAVCAHPDDHRGAMAAGGAYLQRSSPDRGRDAIDLTPDFSRRARGVTAYAALRHLGREGLEALVDRCCEAAQRFAAGLAGLGGVQVLEPCVLNQVLVRFEDDEQTRRIIHALQVGGECWMSGTTWEGRAAMRISTVNWRTTAADVDRSIAAIATAVQQVAA